MTRTIVTNENAVLKNDGTLAIYNSAGNLLYSDYITYSLSNNGSLAFPATGATLEIPVTATNDTIIRIVAEVQSNGKIEIRSNETSLAASIATTDKLSIIISKTSLIHSTVFIYNERTKTITEISHSLSDTFSTFILYGKLILLKSVAIYSDATPLSRNDCILKAKSLFSFNVDGTITGSIDQLTSSVITDSSTIQFPSNHFTKTKLPYISVNGKTGTDVVYNIKYYDFEIPYYINNLDRSIREFLYSRCNHGSFYRVKGQKTYSAGFNDDGSSYNYYPSSTNLKTIISVADYSAIGLADYVMASETYNTTNNSIPELLGVFNSQFTNDSDNVATLSNIAPKLFKKPKTKQKVGSDLTSVNDYTEIDKVLGLFVNDINLE